VCQRGESSGCTREVIKFAESPEFGAQLLAAGLFGASLLASNPSVKAPLQPAKLFQGTGKGGCDVGSRSALQPVWLD
jgi:hypothetical protein